ncbi:MAG: hypothetical protein HQK96_07005 [Nitrospirae bacterium]|nr:hypothetical protein [Nitrospirota bacterium]
MIKNYTSEVPAAKSIAHIEHRLVEHGANNILKIYEEKRLAGISFTVTVSGSDIPFRLPARIDRVGKRLLSTVKKMHKGTEQRILEQAERTGWKLLSDWVDIQMSLIELDQVELMEVFMPYIYNHKKEQSLFEQMKSIGFMLEDKR